MTENPFPSIGSWVYAELCILNQHKARHSSWCPVGLPMKIFFHVRIFSSSKVTGFTQCYSFPCLAARAGDSITEPKSLHRKSRIQKQNALPKRTQRHVTFLVMPWRKRPVGLASHPLQKKSEDDRCETMTARIHTGCTFSPSHNLKRLWWGHLDHSICSSLLQWDEPAVLLGSPSAWGASPSSL